MSQTFFFYDLETSGLDPRSSRIMQFAGIRTTMELKPMGDPINVLVKLNDDTLPSPEALLVTGITSQETLADGYTEAEFSRMLSEEVCSEETIMVGFNNIRFDDEFIRYLLWRNFYDPYEWCWKDGRSRWDILDVVRMTRALRPDGIVWPTVEGKEVNKLELITAENGIEHLKAHDALSDVEGLIAVTKLLKDRQPQLFDYLLKMRDKNKVKAMINLESPQPFVYTSGRYDGEYHKTTVAYPLTSGKNGNVIVYDLRHDPSIFVGLSENELAEKLFAPWEKRREEGFVRIPVKELQYNRAPAVAPLGVLEQGGGWGAIGLSPDVIQKHLQTLRSAPHFAKNIRSLHERTRDYAPATDPEAQLYDGFLNDHDKLRAETVRNATEHDLADYHPDFRDDRLGPLLVHYKARNYPKSLSDDEMLDWEKWRGGRIHNMLPGFMASLQKLATERTSEKDQFMLQEMQLWAESIIPSDLSE